MTVGDPVELVLVSNCSGRGLREIPRDLAPNSTFTRLDGNSLPGLTNWTHPGPHSTRVLFLNHSEVTFIERGFFSAFPQLKILHLHDNELATMPEDLYAMTSIETLLLHDNALQTINFTSVRRPPPVLTLWGNAWRVCDCDLVSLVQKLVLKDQRNYPNQNIVCPNANNTLPQKTNSSGSSNLTANETALLEELQDLMRGVEPPPGAMLLGDVDIEKVCTNHTVVNQTNPLNTGVVVLASTVGGSFVFLVAVGIVVFRFRELILVLLYNNTTTQRIFRPKEKVTLLAALSWRRQQSLQPVHGPQIHPPSLQVSP